MGKLLQNPYGTSSFEAIVKLNRAFVDKTMFIKYLDELSSFYPILLRPRRFGKSTFVSMLKYFYDQSMIGEYDNIFSRTKIYKENLQSHNTYHVFSLDFSNMSISRNTDIYRNFAENLIDSIDEFQGRYPTFSYSIDPQDADNFYVIMKRFFRSYRAWSRSHPEHFPKNNNNKPILKNLYIIIDEYDNFANEILNKDRELFKELTSESGLLKDFFSLIKSETDSTVAKTFITGVSSISLDSITSGFNIAKNITTSRWFNEYAGMTEEELREIIKDLLDYESFNIDLEQMIDEMRQAYNGYAFSKYAKNKLFNTSMCLNYIDQIIEAMEYVDPNKVFDPACNFDPKRLYDLLKHTEHKQLRRVLQTYYDDQIFEIENISESININQIEQYDYQTVISILFYLGYLTIKPKYEQEQPNDNLLLVCPNKFIRKLFRKCFVEYIFYEQDDFLKNFTFDLACIENNEDDLSSFVKSCEEYLRGRLTNQHLIRMTESELVAILKTKIETNDHLTSLDEYAIQVPSEGERFIDLYIENKSKGIYIIEFKYISKTAYEKNSKLIEQKKEEADRQLKLYKQATNFIGKDVKAYSMIFMDCKCVHYEKI